MTYLTRPVFEFPLNWVDDPSATFNYDLREFSLGFGGASFGQLQLYTARGWTFTLDFATADDLAEFEAFCDSVQGRLSGFWLPCPLQALHIRSGVSSTQLDAADSGLRDTISDHPDQHFLFTKPDGTKVASKCTSAAAFDSTTERLTFSPAFGATPAPSWLACRMLYVRFASDDESGSVIGEGRQIRTIKVFELPTEYATLETGESPVFLFRFYVEQPDGSVDSWRYTSALNDVVSGAETFTALNISHGSLRRSMRADLEELQVEAPFSEDAPWANFLPFPSTMPLWLELSSAPLADPDTAAIEFTGRLGPSPEFNGRKVTMKFASWMDSLSALMPRPLIGPRCPYKLGEPATCKADLAGFEKTAVIVSQKGSTLLIEDVSLSGLAANWFAFGWLTVGKAPNIQVRSILASTVEASNQITLRLNLRLVGIEDATSLTIMPGCDKAPATCTAKFDNFVNFGGFPFVPRTNLALKAVEIDPSGGAKK